MPVVAFAMYYDYSSWGGASGYKINMPAYKNVFVHDAGATLPDMTAYAAYASTSWAGAFEGYAFTTAQVAEFHAAIATVDVIIDETYPNGQTYDSILTSYGYNASTALPRAFQTGHVFALDGTMDSRGPPYGGTDWFESRIAEPDAFLEDLVKVAHSNVTASTQLKFLRHVLSGGHKVVTAADCAGTATAARTPSASACSSLAGATPTLGASSARFSYLRTEGSCATPASVRFGTCSTPPSPPASPPSPSPSPTSPSPDLMSPSSTVSLPSPAPVASPPSPSLPPLIAVVRFSVTVSGSVSDYGASQISSLQAAYAAKYAVDPKQVEIILTAASVNIAVEIQVASMEAATALQAKVNQSPDHAAILTSAGITATVESFIAASAAPVQAAEAEEQASPVGIILGVVGGLLAAGLIALLVIYNRSGSAPLYSHPLPIKMPRDLVPQKHSLLYPLGPFTTSLSIRTPLATRIQACGSGRHQNQDKE